MNKYSCIILHCGYAEECMTAPLLFNTAMANVGREEKDKIIFNDPEQALLTLAEDIWSKSCDTSISIDSTMSLSFRDYLFRLHRSTFDFSNWNDENTIVPDNSTRECFWEPFGTNYSFESIQKNEFIFIPDSAELVLSVVLIKNHKKFPEIILGIDNDCRSETSLNTLQKVIDNAGKIWY